MPIRIVESPEPRSEEARTRPVLLVESDAARLLKHELRRYCNREIAGRSFLIAGHRGAGKTTMIENAWLDVWKENELGETRLRPLYVLMHGPSLFPDDALLADERADGGAKASLPAESPPAQAASATDTASGNKQEKTENTETKKDPIQLALEQMILSLHRAVATEFARDYWRRLTSPRPGDTPMLAMRRRRALQPELAAQFQAELSECPSPARLREFFAHADALKLGALHRSSGQGEPIGYTDGNRELLLRTQGAREIVALSGMCEAHRRVSGTFKLEEKIKDEAKREAEAKVSFDSSNTKLVPSLISLVTGAAVGVAAQQASESLLAGTLTGLVTALGASLVFKGTSTSSRSRSAPCVNIT